MEIEKSKIIEIAILDNGYLVETHNWESTDEHGNKVYGITEEVIETRDDEGLKRLLYLIAEKTGCCYDKYGEENLNITFDKKGHKLE